MNTLVSQLLLQLFLILLNAFFAATELSLLSLSTTKLMKMKEDGDKSADRLLKLANEPSSFLSTIQVGITLAGFLGSAFAAENFSDYLVTWISVDLGITAIPVSVLDTIAVILITIILSYFTLVLGELVPKRIAMQKPLEIARVSSIVVSALAVVLRPVVWFLSFSTNIVLKLLRMKTEAEEENVTEDEIRMMVDLGQQKGMIAESEQKWIQNVFEFNDTTVREAMTRQSEVFSISVDATREEIIEIIRTSGLSRFPVYGRDVNDVLGILSARVFLLNDSSDSPLPLRELLQPVCFVPETIHADRLFKDMQTKKFHIAVVVDEYGESVGVITLEDLLEEIVGNIYDEFDAAQPSEIEQLEENLWRMAGTVTVDTLNETLGTKIDEDADYETLGGMVFSRLTAIPEDGSTLDLEINGLSIHVESITEHRVQSALVRKVEPAGHSEGTHAE